MTLQLDPIRLLSPNPAQARLLATVRAQMALPGAPLAAIASYIPSYYDDNRTHDERAVVSGVGPKGGKALLSPLLRGALHDAAFAFGDDSTEGSEDALLVMPGATLMLREHGGPAQLAAVVADPDADPARGFHGLPGRPLTPTLAAWLATRAPAEDATALNPKGQTHFVLRPDAKTWAAMSAHQRLEHHRKIQSDTAGAAWIDGIEAEGVVVLERAGRLGIVSMLCDEWSGKIERHPLALLAL